MPDGADKDTMAVALWADGMRRPCTTTTCEMANNREAPKLEGKRAAAETWWTGKTKKDVELQLRRVSRSGKEWAQLWDAAAEKQILQCVDTSPPMVTWLIEHCIKYAADTIDKVEFEVLKKAKLAEKKKEDENNADGKGSKKKTPENKQTGVPDPKTTEEDGDDSDQKADGHAARNAEDDEDEEKTAAPETHKHFKIVKDKRTKPTGKAAAVVKDKGTKPTGKAAAVVKEKKPTGKAAAVVKEKKAVATTSHTDTASSSVPDLPPSFLFE